VLITPYFVFIHVRKTGGKFIKQVCREHLPEDWFVPHAGDDHVGIRQIPDEYAHLPVFAVIRNPWDWYVSWYHFTRQRERWAADYDEGSEWRWAFDLGHASFKQATSALCGEPVEKPPEDAKEPEWITKARSHDWDLYSHWCHIVFQEGPGTGRIDVGRYERLSEDFLGFLERHAVPVPGDFARALTTSERVNPSEHGPYRDYYDPELRDLVAYKCRGIIETYGYTFEGS
jgi:hypothetical protein